MKRIVILTGAGMSVESGLGTFRGGGGLWDSYPVEKVATPEGYRADPALVLEFYNKRRRELLNVEPNEGHKLIASLEERYSVTVVTQNVDNLHERAGSTNVIHLHGELIKPALRVSLRTLIMYAPCLRPIANCALATLQPMARSYVLLLYGSVKLCHEWMMPLLHLTVLMPL
jgi:hypothetical protein